VQALLGWMQQNGGRLRVHLDDEALAADDLSPAGEAAIRAHLRLVSEALAATAGPATRDGLEELAEGLPQRLRSDDEGLDRELELLEDATAHELDLQFGVATTADDAAMRAMVERRLRVQAWSRYFVRLVAEAVGDDQIADDVFVWMGDRQTDLANMIFTMDRRAKEAEIARRGPTAVDDHDLVNQIGQAAMLQAHVRFVVQGLAAALQRPGSV
jgi:hypothetical protein